MIGLNIIWIYLKGNISQIPSVQITVQENGGAGFKKYLKKNEVKPHLKRQWCLTKIDSNFIWQMEQVLDVYERKYDPRFPVICFDERPCQLIEDVLVPIPVEPGKPRREGAPPMAVYVGIDVGGTFTDLVMHDGAAGGFFNGWR